MGAALAMHRVTPPRSRKPPSPVTPVANRSAKKSHHLATQCRKCGSNLSVTYPLAVTFWKFTCTSCDMPYSIEIVGHRKCLVYIQHGRKTVERIGLTNERSTYYRAKCYACQAVIIVSEKETDNIKSCHQCHMDFTMRKVQGEVYYETVVQHQGTPVTFRDKVQSLAGHIINKNNMFFLDEDILDGSPHAMVETLGLLENEIAALRDREESTKTTLLQMHAEKAALSKELKHATEKSAELISHLRNLEKHAQTLETENRIYIERIHGYEVLARDLEHKTEHALRLEGKIESLNHGIHKLNDEKQKLTNDLRDQSARLTAAEKERTRYAERMRGHEMLVRELDQKTDICTHLERTKETLNQTILTLNNEKQLWIKKSSEQSKLLSAAEKIETKHAELQETNNRLSTEYNRLKRENQLLIGRLKGYTDLPRDLDYQIERATKFEAMYSETSAKVKKLTAENQQLTNRLAGHHEMLHDLGRHAEKVTLLENLNQEIHGKLRKLKDENQFLSKQINSDKVLLKSLEREKKRTTELETANREFSRKCERLMAENHLLNSRLNEQESQKSHLEKQLQKASKSTPDNNTQWEERLHALQQENEHLTLKVQGQNHLEARIFELETEVDIFRRRNDKRTETKEEWYCEEGEALNISQQEKYYKERWTLGLKGEPTPKRIKSALRRRVKKYHPDMIASMGIELRELAHRKTQEITRSYSTLMRAYG